MIKGLDKFISSIPESVDKNRINIWMNEREYNKLCFQLKRRVKTYKGFNIKLRQNGEN